MIALFASVGVQFFDITHTNLNEEKRGFRPRQSVAQTSHSMRFLVPSSFRRQNNVILRPHPPSGVLLVQLDDLNAAALERIRPEAFMILETSPRNFQVWVAVKGADDPDFARRLRKGAGADPSASGATRTAGTANYKTKYAPAFPIVAIHAALRGHIASVERLKALGLVPPPETAQPHPAAQETALAVHLTKRARGVWPSYRYCLDRAPAVHGGDRPDVSRADFAWCMTAIDWGWSAEDVAARLMEESDKAKENGPNYAHTTARNAAAAVIRRRGGPAGRQPQNP